MGHGQYTSSDLINKLSANIDDMKVRRFIVVYCMLFDWILT